MATLRPAEWLNDEVINYFVAMLKQRSLDPSAGQEGGTVYLHNTMFYAKLAESSSGYCYANVRRWTKRDKARQGAYGEGKRDEAHTGGRECTPGICCSRTWTARAHPPLPPCIQVDLFDRDLVIIPINCNNVHWTLALINVRWRRFEYYDSMFGSDRGRLRVLRRYLEDEHKVRGGGGESQSGLG